jgi:AcrR family transcriptional regulator
MLPRSRRRSADETRDRLIEAAAQEFNRVGHHGTDSNRIARAAGYAPGTFYIYFPNKIAIFIAAYQRWIIGEWARIECTADAPVVSLEVARAFVEWVVDHHRRWAGFRASLHALVGIDESLRKVQHEQWRRQLDVLARFRRRAGSIEQPRERDAVLLYMLERTCDALADGDGEILALSSERTVALMAEQVMEHFRPAPAASAGDGAI